MLYPGVFPNLAALTKPRADLVAILLTGLPAGIIPGFQNFTGRTPADMLRLNVAIPPASSPSPLGVLGDDLAGFPNGRRVADDIVNIELRAVGGLTYPLVDPSFTPDAAASQLTQGLTPGPDRYQSTLPVPRPAPRRVQHAPVSHAHEHEHIDRHGHVHEDYAARSHPEFVVLDIGGDVGALIVHAPRTCWARRSRSAPPGRTTGAATRTSSSGGWATARPTPPSSTACARASTRSGATTCRARAT